jgi:hypothetical protein
MLIRATILAGGVLLGTGGTIGAQNVSKDPVDAVKPQIIEVRPTCPAIYLDNVKIGK